MAGEVEFDHYVEHKRAFNRTFRSWTGPVGVHLADATKLVAVTAKITSPKDTGELAGGHEVDLRHHGVKRDLEGRVVAVPKQAIYVIKGTAPHVIKARKKPLLVFFWKKVGHVVNFKSVNHPGHPAPNNYLGRALTRVMRRFT
jgi:hypothetical protein